MREADIYVTLGAEQLKEKPYRVQIENFKACDGEHMFFWWRLSNPPTRPVRKVFIVIGNKVRWSATVIDTHIAPKGEMIYPNFSDGHVMGARAWLILIDFVKLPAPYEIKKGFQGFRYKEIE